MRSFAANWLPMVAFVGVMVPLALTFDSAVFWVAFVVWFLVVAAMRVAVFGWHDSP